MRGDGEFAFVAAGSLPLRIEPGFCLPLRSRVDSLAALTTVYCVGF